MEFKKFPKIERLDKQQMSITQKLHGTNAQIHIYEEKEYIPNAEHKITLNIRAGSRIRWIFPEDDNFGFANWVEDNREVLIEFLGEGTHYGEWVGRGINSGEGLEDKQFFLFDWWKYQEVEEFPKGLNVVPLLYNGPLDLDKVAEVMADLKENGSRVVEGFMRPEGVVVNFSGTRYKKVFDAEETAWKKPEKSNKGQNPKKHVDFSHLCQPLRLEKLLSKDERYMREYPKSLGMLVKAYIEDLVEEKQIVGDKDQIKAIRKACTRQVFQFVKSVIKEKLG